jgi:hypothetical protein
MKPNSTKALSVQRRRTTGQPRQHHVHGRPAFGMGGVEKLNPIETLIRLCELPGNRASQRLMNRIDVGRAAAARLNSPQSQISTQIQN